MPLSIGRESLSQRDAPSAVHELRAVCACSRGNSQPPVIGAAPLMLREAALMRDLWATVHACQAASLWSEIPLTSSARPHQFAVHAGGSHHVFRLGMAGGWELASANSYEVHRYR